MPKPQSWVKEPLRLRSWVKFNNSGPGVTPATSEIFGYLSKVEGIDPAFTDPTPANQNETTALLTFDTQTTTIRTTTHGPFNIIDRDGTTSMYLNNGPSNFADPSTFARGTLIQVSTFHQQVIVDTVENTFTVINANDVTSTTQFKIGDSKYLLGAQGKRRERLSKECSAFVAVEVLRPDSSQVTRWTPTSDRGEVGYREWTPLKALVPFSKSLR